MEAETGVMPLYIKGCQGLSATTGSQEGDKGEFSPKTFREDMILSTPRFGTSGLQNCERINFC